MAILAAILENMQLLLLFFTYLNSTSFISYESTLYSSLYLKAELRYIRFRFSAAILAAILNFFILFILDITQQYFTNRKSLKSYGYFHCISYLVEVILVSRIGRRMAAILAAILKNNQRMIFESIPLDLPSEKTPEKIAFKALYVAYNSKYCGKRQFSHKLNIWRQKVSSSRHDVMSFRTKFVTILYPNHI